MATITVEIRYANRPSDVKNFAQAKVTIGRESGDIVLGDPAASGQHAEINITSTNVTYVDLNSTNGSFLPDGRRLGPPIALQPGNEVRIGGCAIILRDFQAGGARYGAKGTLVMAEYPEAAPASPPKMESLRAGVGAAPAGLAFDDTVKPNQVSPFHAGAQPPPGIGAPPLGAYPPGAPPGQHLGAPPPGAPPPGQYQYPGAPGMGAPMMAGIGAGGALEPGAFLSSAVEAYKPHMLEATKVIGIVAIPLALLNAVAGYIPFVGVVIAILTSIALALFNVLVGVGAQAEFGLRLAAGVPMTAPQALKLQVGRMIPWFVGLFLPALLAGLGAICIVPFILFGFFLLPVYMVEKDKSGIDINKRVFELVQKEPVMVAVLIGVVFAAALGFGLATLVLGLLPFIGAALVSVLSAVFSAAFSPFVTFLTFRLYFAIRQKHERVDAAAIARATLAPVA